MTFNCFFSSFSLLPIFLFRSTKSSKSFIIFSCKSILPVSLFFDFRITSAISSRINCPKIFPMRYLSPSLKLLSICNSISLFVFLFTLYKSFSYSPQINSESQKNGLMILNQPHVAFEK